MKKKILAIDDDPIVLRTVSNLLISNGYEVVSHKDGEAAIADFKNHEFDLIICDIRMPKDNGIEIVKQLREIEHDLGRLTLPIIMITGYAEEEAPIAAIKAGVQDYFLKPFDNNELLTSIKSHLQQSKKTSGFSHADAQRITFSIIGIGVISPFGASKEAYWDYINTCTPLNDRAADTDFSELNGCRIMKIKGFSPTGHFNEKQLHNVEDNSAFVATAAKFAIDDAKLIISKIGSDEVGVAIGTSASIGTSMSDFEESVLRDGSRRSRIGIFPNTVICAPASRISIFEHITGSNTTVSSGMNSGIDAIGYACFCLESEIAKAMLAGGSDALSEKLLLGYAREELLIKEPVESLQSKAGRFIPSEGACVFVLKKAEKSTGHESYCEILSYESGFSPFKKREVIHRIETLNKIAGNCLKNAGIGMDAISCVLLSSYFDEFDYAVETGAVEQLLAKGKKTIPVLAAKKVLGEGFSVSGPELVLLAIGLFLKRITSKAITGLNINKHFSKPNKIGYVLILSTDSGGHQSALLLKAVG